MSENDDFLKQRVYPYDTRLNPMPAPAVGIYDNPLNIRLNPLWASHIEGLCDRLLWRDAWTGTDEQIDFAIEQIRKWIKFDDFGAGDMIIRQNPLNACQLQYSIDGGNNWVLGFDYSLCVAGVSQSDLATLQQNLMDAYNAILGNYLKNGVSGIAPNLVYTGVVSDNNARNIALCNATKYIVSLCCETVKKQRTEQVSIANIFLGGVALTVAMLSSVGIIATAGAGAPLAISLGSAVLSFAGNAFNSISNIVLSDDETISNVACCMYNSLRGATPTKAGFMQSLSNCQFGAGTNEAQLAGAISPILSNDDIFATFLKIADDYYIQAKTGAISCDCENASNWFKSFNFINSAGNWVSKQDTLARDYALYNAGLGFSRANNSTTQSRLSIATPQITTTITRCKVYFSSVYTLLTGGSVSLNVMTDRVYTAYQWANIYSGGQSVLDIDYSGSPINLVNQRFNVNMGNSTTQNGTAFPLNYYIVGCDLYGNGANPF